MDKSRLINGQILDEDYFDHLIFEIQESNEIVTMYLDYATRQARRPIPMTMADWVSKLDAFLQFNDAEILQNQGKVTTAIAKSFAEESEFEQYRIIQDRLYQSDFDRLVASSEEKTGNDMCQNPFYPVVAVLLECSCKHCIPIATRVNQDFLW